VASREGAFTAAIFGERPGSTPYELADKDITSITYDATGKSMLATSLQTERHLQSTDSGRPGSVDPTLGIRCGVSAWCADVHRRNPV